MPDKEETSTSEDLLIAIKELMTKSGHLNKLRAEVRACVTEALQQSEDQRHSGDHKSSIPEPTEEVLLINELVREYLEWNGSFYTASIFSSEAALPQEKKNRADMCNEVGVKDDEKSSALPLLSNMVFAYIERIKRKLNKIRD